MTQFFNSASNNSRTIDDDITFRKLIENSNSGITLLNRAFQTIYRSPSAERISGWDTASRMKNSIEDLTHPSDIDMVNQLLQEVLISSNIPKTCSFRSKHFKGHYIWLECTFTNMFHEPDVNAIVCNFVDVTEKKQAEQLLEHTIQELSAYKYALNESAIVAITDQKGIIKHVNDNFCKISKYSREELVGKDHRIINSSHHEKAFIRDLWLTIANGKIWKGELKNKAKDGSYYWVDMTIVPFLNEEKKPYQYVAIRSDITERKINEEKVVASEHFLKTITDNLPAMLAYWTADLHCLFANKALLDWFDKRADEMQGIHKEKLMDNDEFLEHKPYIQNVLEGKLQSFDSSFFKANGKTIYTHTQYVPDIRDGKVKGFYSLIYDYSEVRSVELEILKKTAQIEDLLENITDGFIALDENMCYTYANKHIGKMLGRTPESLIGNNIWELFPDVLDSATYHAIQTAFLEKKYVCNEDYYEPLNLWQENRVYPSGNGLSIFIRDISDRKTEELQKALLSAIDLSFNGEMELNETLHKVLEQLASFGDFSMAEAWLIESDKKKISRIAKFSKKEVDTFFKESLDIKTFIRGAGMPGVTWETATTQFWRNIDEEKKFIRRTAAKKAGLKSAYGLPLFYNTEIIGVLVLSSTINENRGNAFTRILESIGSHLGVEIKRKQLEQELNQVFQFTPDILCVANIDGYFKKVNPAMSTLLEYNEEELLSIPFMEIVHPLDKENTAAELQNIVNGKPTYYIENRYITKSGKIKWLAWTTTGASEQGTLYCSAKDITDKKDLEELLHKATNLARIGGWEIDLVKNTVYWSDITKEIHETEPGFKPDMETGIHFYQEGKSRETIVLKIKELIENGISCDEELQIVTAKGNTKWIRVIGEAEFADNKCVRMYGSFQDIDALKKAEIIAKETLEERNTILESIDDAFFAVDKNWIVTYWNKTAEKVLTKAKEDMIDNNLWDVFSDSIDSQSYRKYHQAIETNQAEHFEDYYSPLNKWYEISAYPSGSGLSVYFKDITDRKMSELQLTELNEVLKKHTKELAVSNAELEQFAYVASHDLQEPLRMVTSFLTQLERKYNDIIDDKGKQYIHFAVDGAKRMRQIILDLLEFSRVGRLDDSMEEVNISKVVSDILALYRKQIEEQNARITFDGLPTIRTYKVPLRQIFQNLISNSLKYQKPGNSSLINISGEDTEEYWKFSVRDNGIGIDPEFFDKIFIIFQRLHNKDEYSGTGMGLAITKKIVENLGGRIWLESEEGKGSTFYFTIHKNKL